MKYLGIKLICVRIDLMKVCRLQRKSLSQIYAQMQDFFRRELDLQKYIDYLFFVFCFSLSSLTSHNFFWIKLVTHRTEEKYGFNLNRVVTSPVHPELTYFKLFIFYSVAFSYREGMKIFVAPF